MNQTRKFRVAVIGLGWWGKTIVQYLKNARNIDAVLATDLNQDAGRAFAQSQGVEFAPSFEAAIHDPRIEGVVLCTPHSMHADQMVAVAAAGKHIFCEKPLCLNRADVLRAMRARQNQAASVAKQRSMERKGEVYGLASAST